VCPGRRPPPPSSPTVLTAGGHNGTVTTELLYLTDAYLREFDATVTAVDASGRVVQLDRTAFYATGGGQPHDTGTLAGIPVVDVRKDGGNTWHTLGGVIWKEWGKAVTGGNMEPLSARMDFEFDPLPEGFGRRVEELVNAELAAARPIAVSFLPRGTAVMDEDLIRTKVNMIPEPVSEIRVIDIIGLDKQADGGTHVHSTAEVRRIRVLKTESKGRGNKRVRLQVTDN